MKIKKIQKSLQGQLAYATQFEYNDIYLTVKQAQALLDFIHKSKGRKRRPITEEAGPIPIFLGRSGPNSKELADSEMQLSGRGVRHAHAGSGFFESAVERDFKDAAEAYHQKSNIPSYLLLNYDQIMRHPLHQKEIFNSTVLQESLEYEELKKKLAAKEADITQYDLSKPGDFFKALWTVSIQNILPYKLPLDVDLGQSSHKPVYRAILDLLNIKICKAEAGPCFSKKEMNRVEKAFKKAEEEAQTKQSIQFESEPQLDPTY